MRREEEFHNKWHGHEVEVISGPFKGQHGVAQYGDSSLNTVAVVFSDALKHGQPIETWFKADALRLI